MCLFIVRVLKVLALGLALGTVVTVVSSLNLMGYNLVSSNIIILFDFGHML